jgi:hypothetical protein
VPGRVVIVPRIAPRLPSQHWGQCRHHQQALSALAKPISLIFTESMWWKTTKTISEEEMGKELWLICNSLAEKFHATFAPMLKSQGFLSNAAAESDFAFENVLLHLWLISAVFANDDGVSAVFHRTFAEANATVGSSDEERTRFQGQVNEITDQRFALYWKAFSKDEEGRAKGLILKNLPKTALECLVKQNLPNADWLTTSAIGLWLSVDAITYVQKAKTQFKIRKT